MAIWDFLFGKKSKLGDIEKMSTGELDKEQLRLEAVQDSIIAKVNTLEKRKDATLREGAKKKSDLERKAMAVRYKQIDAEAADYVSQASLLSKQVRIIGRVAQMKRRESLLKREGLWQIISGVDATELEQFMINMRAKALQGDREATRLLEILEEPATAATEEEDKELRDVLAAMEAIGDSEPTDEKIEEAKKKFLEKEEEGATSGS